ncbi:hypothetical protein BGW39_008106 [Mortierella sp. 14UC]|nr:hypothetical protein BGW39_008106 [Mortierella sp. 14UC]
MSTTINSTQRSTRRKTATSLLFALTTTLLLLTSSTTTAQQSSDAPFPSSGSAFARTPTKLYILGGQTSTAPNTPPNGQFFSLDLASAWSASSPAWKRLQPGPQQAIFPAVFTADYKTMIVFHIPGANNVYKYNVDSGTWAPSPMNFVNSGWQGVGAATDPASGLVYLAAGYTDNTRGSMDIYNPRTDTATQSALPNAATTFGSRWYYTNVWCIQRKSILYFGGYNVTSQPGPPTNSVSEFSPSTGAWGTMATSGTPPSIRADHCMAANDDGTRVVVYGGRPTNNAPFSGEVFVLNTVTGVWTQGASGQPRLYAACAIAGDQLLIWGGVATGDAIAPSAILLYNIATNTWVTDYTPPASYVALAASQSASSASAGAKPTGSGTPGADGLNGGSGEKGGSNIGGIVGGIVGGLAVVAGIVGFLLFRRRRGHRQHQGHQAVKTVGDDYGHQSLHSSGTTAAAAAVGGQQEDEVRKLQSQLENQQQQLEIQRQLLAFQQNQQVQQPIMMQQDTYGYQSPMYYTSAGPGASTVQTVPDTSYAGYTIPVVSPTHSEMYQMSHDPTPAPAGAYNQPLIYMPPPSSTPDYTLPAVSQASSSPAMSATVSSTDIPSSTYGVSSSVSVPVVKKSQLSGPQTLIVPTSTSAGTYADGAGSWDSKPQPNSPHTIVE